MKKINLSLINNDQAVQAKTGFADTQDSEFSAFIEKVKEQLVTGETALLEIEGHEKNSLKFEITQAL